MATDTPLDRRKFGSAVLATIAACSTVDLFGESDAQEPVMKWIRQRASPLAGVSPDLPHRDLEPLKRLLANVQVVGIGENNHGSSEYQVFKHRLLRFLVEEMEFTAFALEASYSSCKAIDNYVVNGIGRLEDVLTSQGYTVWDTLEMAALLTWMRVHNQSAKPGKKLRFFGLDVSYNQRGRNNVLVWLRQHAADHVSTAEKLLGTIGEEEDKWPGRTDHARVKAMLADVQALATFMREAGRKIPTAADPMEDAVWDMTTIEQWVISNSGGVDRSEWMGHNLSRLLSCYPGMKVLTSAFNYHISHTLGTIGGIARAKLGNAYYSLAAEFGSGSFRVRTKDPDNFFGSYRELTLGPAPELSVPWYLAQARKGSLLLDFKERVAGKAITEWMDKPQLMHSTVWVPTESDALYKPFAMEELYDGIYFIDRIRPSRATLNGEISARNRLRF